MKTKYTFTSVKSNIFTKTFSLDERGKLIKKAGGHLTRGTYCVNVYDRPEQFLDYLNNSGTGTANLYGVPIDAPDSGTIASRKHAKVGELTRTRKDFMFSSLAGILMLDVDVPVDSDDVVDTSWENIYRQLDRVIPGFKAEVPHIAAHSTSSFIYYDGKELVGENGKRVYIFVSKASHIPEGGACLFDRLNLLGNMRFTVSKSGAKLKRGLIDDSVFQPERLDYCGGATCLTPGLSQDRPDAVLLNADKPFLNLKKAVDKISSGERKMLKDTEERLKNDIHEKARAVWQQWAEDRVHEKETHTRKPMTDMERATFLKSLEACCEGGVLSGDFLVPLSEPGSFVSVAEILMDRNIWDGVEIPDPLEPDYHNRSLVAKIFAQGAVPVIHSFAHGKKTYRLAKSRVLLPYSSGDLAGAVSRCRVQLNGEAFQRGGGVVEIRESKVCPLSQVGLESKLDSLVTFYKRQASGDKVISCPPALSRRLIDARDSSTLQKLKAVVRYPVMRMDGTVFDDPGYDPTTHLYLDAENKDMFLPVPDSPTEADVRNSYQILMDPFRHFPFVSDVRRGVFLSALLTVPLRPVLPTAPGFLFTAPDYGSGKSLLAACVSTLAGQEAQPCAWADTEDERRKSLFAGLREAPHALLYDNIVTDLRSETLAAALTSSSIGDRVLGFSEKVHLPTNTLMLFTGNRILPHKDLARRILVCEIDPKVQRPDQRVFDFNPLELVKSRLFEMRSAALVLLRAAAQSSEVQSMRSVLGGFEDWERLVNRTVKWLGSLGFPVADPISSIDETFDHDPETQKIASLYTALYQLFETKPVTASEILRGEVVQQEAEDQIAAVAYASILDDTLKDILGDKERHNQRMFSRWLTRHSNRVMCGMRLIEHTKLHNRLRWRMEIVDQSAFDAAMAALVPED